MKFFPEASSGGVSDGDKGDVTVSGGGATWTVDSVAAANVTGLAAAITATPLSSFAAPVAAVAFAQQQATGFVLENRTSDPGSPVSGQIWIRTDL